MTARSGILLVDKPGGITSHGVVSRIRRAAGTRKVGHAGTLDPMATGLLVLGVEASTRLLTYVVGLDKEYLATIRLGVATSTDDREGDITATAPIGSVAALEPARIAAEIGRFVGDISQVPSSVSAIKVDGKRAYALVRAGETVELASRPVHVSAFELLASRRPDDEPAALDLDVRVECSSGTYIRALARDLGSVLGVGGHLTALRRTRIGPFGVADAAALESIDVPTALLTPAEVAGSLFPVVALDEGAAVDLMHGKRLTLPSIADGSPLAATAPDGRLVGLIEVRDGVGRAVVNFPTDAPADAPADTPVDAPADGAPGRPS